MLTIASALNEIDHELGGPLAGIEAIPILNEAGRILCGIRDWNFMVRPPVTLAGTIDDTFLTLPSDFRKIFTIEYTNGLTAKVIQSTLPQIAIYRSQLTAAPGYLLYVATAWAPDANGVPKVRLEIFPKLTVTDPALLTMFYYGNFPNIPADDQGFVPVPEFMEGIYKRVVRAVAAGYHNPQSATMGARLADIVAGPDWQAAVRTDSEQLFEHGLLRNGALSQGSETTDGQWFITKQILPPVAS